jgi:hypothetical protein
MSLDASNPLTPARSRAVLGLAMTAAIVGLPAFAQEPPTEVASRMRDAGFSDAQIRKAAAGGVLTRVLHREEDNAVFVTGVARIAAPDDALAEGIRSLEVLRRGSRTLQIGCFGTPPGIEDIQALSLEGRDLDSLRRCHPGDCDVKIGRDAMERIRAIDWEAVGARARAAQVIKEVLVARLGAYQEGGSSAMAAYVDDDPPESVAHGLETILRESPDLVQRNPAFFRYVLDYPNGEPPPNVESLFYWSKEKLRKPVVSIVHVVLQRSEGDGQASYHIAMKHIYDSHYFRAYAEFLTAIPEARSGEGFYLMRSVRALIDPPGGWFRGFLLGRIKRAMCDELAADLRRTRARLESSASGPSLISVRLPDRAEPTDLVGDQPIESGTARR